MHDDTSSSTVAERRKLENEAFSFEGEKKNWEQKKQVLAIEVTRAKKQRRALEPHSNCPPFGFPGVGCSQRLLA